MAPQLSYGTDFVEGLAGQKADSGFGHVISRTAQEVTPFGVLMTAVQGDPEKGQLPRANTAAILEDGGTYTAGAFVAVVNGVTVSTAYNTDKATTLGDVATNIAALGFIASAAYASNTITIVGEDNIPVSVTVDISAITGTMTITSTTYALTDRILGFSVRDTIEAGSFRSQVNDRAVATLSGDVLNTSDTVDATLNGVAITQVTYATSEANTLQLVANQLKGIAGVADAVVDSALRTITVTMNPGLPLDLLTFDVTDNALASVAPSFAVVYSAQGVSIDKNAAEFVPTEVLPILRRGQIIVQCEEAMTPASTPFVRLAATASNAQRGRLRTDIDSGNAAAATGVVVIGNSFTDPNGQLCVAVEINLP